MDTLTPRERIIRTIEGGEVDRLAIYDIIHSIDFIEHVTGGKVTAESAEDLACEAIREVLDLVRHFCAPTFTEARSYEDEDGFVIKEEWWTKSIMKRPHKTVDEARELMKKDIERIYKCIEKGQVCKSALEQTQLLGEGCESFEEVKSLFRRIAGKLSPAVMIAPESVPGMYTATHRYGFEIITYLYADYAEEFEKYYQALCDYETAKAKSYGELIDVTPVALVSCEMCCNTGLIWPPKFIKDVQLPRVKQVVDAWKSGGFKVIFHSDGNKWEIMDDVMGLGVDAVDSCESLATMEVKKFRQLYPNMTIASPVDCQELLAHGTKEQIVKACRQVIEDSGGQRVLLGSTSEIHPEIPVENAMAMYDFFRNYTDV